MSTFCDRQRKRGAVSVQVVDVQCCRCVLMYDSDKQGETDSIRSTTTDAAQSPISYLSSLPSVTANVPC